MTTSWAIHPTARPYAVHAIPHGNVSYRAKGRKNGEAG